MDNFKQDFLQETRELLESISSDILAAESNLDDKKLLNSIFRGIHTIKGSAGIIGLVELADFVHHLEGLLDALRNNKLQLEPDIVDLILAGADQVDLMLVAFENEEKPEANDELMAEICAAYQEDGDDVQPVDGKSSDEKPSDNKQSVYKITLNYPDELTPENDPQHFLDKLKSSSKTYQSTCELQVDGPVNFSDFQSFNAKRLHLLPVIECATELSASQIKDLAAEAKFVEINRQTKIAEPDPVACSAVKQTELVLPAVDDDDIAAFLEDAEDHVTAMEQAVIRYEKDHDRDSLDELFRGAHSIKGDADFLQLEVAARFSHELEGVLVRLRQDELQPTRKIIDVLLVGVDGLKSIVAQLIQGKDVDDFPAGYEKLVAVGNGGQQDDLSEDDKLAGLDGDMREVFLDQVVQQREILANHSKVPITENDHEIIKRSLAGLTRACAFVELPALNDLVAETETCLAGDEDLLLTAIGKVSAYIDGLTGEPKPVGEILVDEGKVSSEDVKDALKEQKPVGEILVDQGKVTKEDVAGALDRQKPIGEILVEQGKVEKAEVKQALVKQEIMELADSAKSVVPDQQQRTMRVSENKIEDFSNMVGEMLVAHNSYEYLVDGLSELACGAELAGYLKPLKENLHLFSRLVGNMHHGIMSMRMIPIKGVFQKYSRVVRDIARKQQKEIRFILQGEDTEVDKKVADALSDPLIHLIRNCCDHGIETPEKRKAAGKDEKGTVILSAAKQGSNLIIKISDDGGGINKEKLVERAMHAGIEIDGMGEAEIHALIFEAGLTTMDKATDLSGRGVGMDVVKASIDSLGGNVEVASGEGKGTDITMIIPMTMGISVVLLIESAGQPYGLPFEHVLETIKIMPSALHQTGNQLIFHYRGQVIPADFLENRLQDNHLAMDVSEFDPDKEISLVILKSGSSGFGLIVDRFIRNMEMAIKPLPPALAAIGEVSGASILGDGRLILLLNPVKIVG